MRSQLDQPRARDHFRDFFVVGGPEAAFLLVLSTWQKTRLLQCVTGIWSVRIGNRTGGLRSITEVWQGIGSDFGRGVAIPGLLKRPGQGSNGV